MKLNYAQQIKRPEWQKKRLEVLEDKGFKCENCGTTDAELHVHHPFYRRGSMVWQYDLNELMCLCIKCHKDEHAIDERIKKAVAILRSPSLKHQILGYIEAIDGDTPIYPTSYEYCMGVADLISYKDEDQPLQNKRNDMMQEWIFNNKGCDGLFFMEGVSVGVHNG